MIFIQKLRENSSCLLKYSFYINDNWEVGGSMKSFEDKSSTKSKR